MDFTYVNEDSDISSAGQRSRQQSAATSFSDVPSITSLPFGPSFYTQANQDPFGEGGYNQYGAAAFGNNFLAGRRDSGYGVSPYISSPPMGYGQVGRNGQARQRQNVSK